LFAYLLIRLDDLKLKDWKVLTASPSLSPKYDLLLGSHNGVSRRTQRLAEREVEAVKLFPFENLRTLQVKVF